MESSYTKFIKMMRTQGAAYNPEGIKIATVITEDPLTIDVDDLPLDKDNLLIADYLLENYSRKISIPSTSAAGSTTDGSIESINIPDGNLSFTDGLKKDDMLAVIKISKLKYLILCKVVSL